MCYKQQEECKTTSVHTHQLWNISVKPGIQ